MGRWGVRWVVQSCILLTLHLTPSDQQFTLSRRIKIRIINVCLTHGLTSAPAAPANPSRNGLFPVVFNLLTQNKFKWFQSQHAEYISGISGPISSVRGVRGGQAQCRDWRQAAGVQIRICHWIINSWRCLSVSVRPQNKENINTL